MELAYDTFGPNAGHTVVLLHGMTNSRATYADLVPWLLDRGLRVISVDLRGHGDTGWADSYRAGEYASDVARLVDRLALGPVVVVGHSLGGLVAATLAGMRPDMVEGLFLEDPPLYQGEESIRRSDPIVEGFAEFADQIRRWQQDDVDFDDIAAEYGESESPYPGVTTLELLGPDRLETRVTAYLHCDPAALDAAYQGRLWDGYDPAAAISCPVTVVAADSSLDGVFRPEHAERYRLAVPQARVVTIEGSAHSIRLHEKGIEIYKSELRALIDSL